MFAVAWIDEAFEEMARFVRENPARKIAFAGALAVITDRLSRNPAAEGESRADDTRVMHVRPFTVYFTVDEEEQVALIGRVILVD